MVAAHRGYHRPTGEWNFQEVTVQGSKIKVEPIRKKKDINLIKKLLSDKPLDQALFTVGINTNLRASDLLALQDLDVLFAIDRAGLVGEDGPTHAGSFDISYLRCIPNMLPWLILEKIETRSKMSYRYHKFCTI